MSGTHAPTDVAPVGAAGAARQAAVLACVVVAALGLAAGVGAFGGTPVGEVDGLSAQGSLVAPYGPAFAIWTPIYLGLLGYGIWQAAPSRRDDPRLRRVALPVGVSAAANAAWILAAQAELLALSVVLIVVILAAAVVALVRLRADRPRSRTEALLLDATTGLYAGWVTVATVANVAATLVTGGRGDLWPGRTAWAVLILLVAGLIGGATAWVLGGRVAYPAAVVWGLAWIAVARLAGPTESGWAAGAAVFAAALVVAGVVSAHRGPRMPS